jgi:hypothetical protein
MKNTNIQKFLTNPTYIVVIVIGLILMSVVIILAFRGKKSIQAPIKKGQIQIVKGDEVITINENGLVEYKSKDKVYTETWDASQISSFFSMMEQKARDYLGKKVSGGDCGYKVFMYIDKKLVTVCIDSNDSDLGNTIEPIFIKYSDVDLSDYFGSDDDTENGDDEDEFDGEIHFPTPTSTGSRITPSPTPYSIYNINTNYAPVKADCETWSGSIVRNRAIISNTFCTVNTTPTPTP